MFSIHHQAGVKLLVRLRHGFSHLHEQKLRKIFHDTLNPLCSCSLEPETTSHYLFCYNNFSSTGSALMNDLNLIDCSVSQLHETAGKKCLFFGNFGVLCFLETPVLRFALLPYYRRNMLLYGDSKKIIPQNSKI